MSYHDPHVTDLFREGLQLRSVELIPEQLSSVDCVVIVTDHSSIDYEQLRAHAPRVVDTRNALNRRQR